MSILTTTVVQAIDAYITECGFTKAYSALLEAEETGVMAQYVLSLYLVTYMPRDIMRSLDRNIQL